MPTFCRHNRLIQNCPICSREQGIERRPLLSSSTVGSSEQSSSAPARRKAGANPQRSGPGVKVQRLARETDDGYRSSLVPGLKSSVDAARLAEELACSAGRLMALESDPPGLYAEVADGASDLEQRTWLAFLIAYLCPLQGERPFAEIDRVRTSWPTFPDLEAQEVTAGPRSSFEPGHSARTFDAYLAWANRAGSQQAAFRGEPGWSPERRFDRLFERLALPGLDRDCRFDLLVTTGRLGLYELRAARLALGGANEVTIAAKRILGIGDPLLLERRAGELASACGVPLDALDLAFYNWSRTGERVTLGLGAGEPDSEVEQRARAALQC